MRAALLAAVLLMLGGVAVRAQALTDASSLPPWQVPDISTVPDDETGQLVRAGRDLLRHTSALIGPDAKDPAMRFAGNGLECQSCHLDAGTVRFGLPLVGIWGMYPAFSARVGAVQTMGDRINDCMQRSMNGRALPPDSRALQAIEAYIQFLGTGQATGTAPIGRGAPKLPQPGRAADPVRGEAVFRHDCAACHRDDGHGIRYSFLDAQDKRQRYLFPPLWGPDSFNDGAGMARVMTAAWFVHANMPRGVSFTTTALSVEQAYDVAAYIASQPRPRKPGLARDYPDPWLKPADAAFAPLLGPFSRRQHEFGPWPPIEAWVRAHTPPTVRGPRGAGDVEAIAAPQPSAGR